MLGARGMGRPQSEQLVLVTVGTTKFDQLIRAIDDVELLHVLHKNGYRRLTVQHGQGDYVIRNIHPSPLADFDVRCAYGNHVLCVSTFDDLDGGA